MIELDIPQRSIHLDISDDEMEKRRQAWQPAPFPYTRGYTALFAKHVTQANEGCDFDFLHAGDPTPEPQIF